MRTGLYIDAFNLYYGGRSHFGPRRPGWRWLNLRALGLEIVAAQQARWPDAALSKIVYCTARTGEIDQDAYLKALRAAGAHDWVEWGRYAEKLIHRPLATQPRGEPAPVIVRSQWPVRIQNATTGADVQNARFMVSVSHREEKGSDVNLATHLLLDILQEQRQVDAVIVITNDSDLALPLREARQRVSVGLMNPGDPHKRPTAGALRAEPDNGVGGHWWGHLRPEQYLSNQLPDPVVDDAGAQYNRPRGW